MIGMIAAMTKDRVIGRDRVIPWRYRGDFARFKRLTMDSTVIMGRKTFESMGSKPLTGRTNVVVSASTFEVRANYGAESPLASARHIVVQSLSAALMYAKRGMVWHFGSTDVIPAEDGDVWLIGGSQIYEAGLSFADVIDLTIVPDAVPVEGSVLFPTIDDRFRLISRLPHPDESALWVDRYERAR